MKAAPFTYHAPRDLPEALDLLATLDNARLLAGGQTLMPMVNMRVAQPDHLIDLNRIEDLSGIREVEDLIVIGAMTRQATLERSAVIDRKTPILVEALAHVGYPATRNRGTIGGTLCHLDPNAELPVVMAALDAQVTLRSQTGERRASFVDFALDMLTPDLADGEMLTAVTFRPWPRRHGSAFLEIAYGTSALATAAALIDMDADRRIRRTAVAVGGAVPVPRRLPAVEAMLEGRTAEPDLFAQASLAASELDVEDDALVPAAYRRSVAATVVRRALDAAARRARAGGPG